MFSVENDENGSQSYKLLIEMSAIKPNYEAMIKGGHLKVTETGIQPSKSLYMYVLYTNLHFLTNLVETAYACFEALE